VLLIVESAGKRPLPHASAGTPRWCTALREARAQNVYVPRETMRAAQRSVTCAAVHVSRTHQSTPDDAIKRSAKRLRACSTRRTARGHEAARFGARASL